MKTAEQIASDIVYEYGGHGVGAYQNIIRGVEADRAQPERDGPIHAAVINELREKAGMWKSDWANRYRSAAEWIEQHPDEFFEEYIDDTLHRIAFEHGSPDVKENLTDERECSRCGDEAQYLDSHDVCDGCNEEEATR